MCLLAGKRAWGRAGCQCLIWPWQECYTALAAVQAVKKEGVYADGVATLQTLPEALHGPDAAVDVQLRLLLEGERLSEDQVTEHASKECQKVCLQPSMRS